ncbi:MAG: FAD-dependent oxidoreductase [Deltaproteobacteria bacterium]|nr:FAD-dependent oxidoreductase [Deltaproteobacteria bacterium]
MESSAQKIAIVGTGISGLTAAHLLHPRHDITLFEANDYIGGHTHTHRIESQGRTHAVDTGFIVFNDWTYPNFIRLLDRLGIESQPSSMSFGIRCDRTGVEYSSASLNSLFAQRRNLLRPSFYRMTLDILRFNRESKELLTEYSLKDIPMGEYLQMRNYSRAFVEHYLLPMGAAVWSSTPEQIRDFPAAYFVRFFSNHGMLAVYDQPQWRVIRGGSKTYVEAITRPFLQKIRLRCPIESVRREKDRVLVKPRGSAEESFDQVIFATHSDQTLRLLSDATAPERDILGAIPYQENQTALHLDTRMLPKRRGAWASWNYLLPPDPQDRVTVTYYMNRLQGIDSPESFCVTLNRGDQIAPEKILKKMIYHHPLYSAAGFAAQKRHAEISGKNRSHFCGAYWGWGFHEDGVNSALAVAKYFGETLA